MKPPLHFPAASEPLPRESRGERLVELLRRNGGYATISELAEATGWARRTVEKGHSGAPIKVVQMMYVLMEDDDHICATCLKKCGAGR